MDNLHQLIRRLRQHLLFMVALENVLVVSAFWALITYTSLSDSIAVGITAVIAILLMVVVTFTTSHTLVQPLQALWQAILHVTPDHPNVDAPNVDKLRIGQQLVASLTAQIYQLARLAESNEAAAIKESADLRFNFIANNLPLPLFVLDPDDTIVFANESAGQYVGVTTADLPGKNVYMVLDMAFPSEDTLDKWLKNAKKSAATATRSWERVRLNVLDTRPTRLFDLAAYYNRANSQGWETMLVLFDHTKQYEQDDQAVSFIALSVHELRTPLTLLRGYIEAFEEELAGKLDPQMNDFMFKMSATAQQLAAFVNNILNVARVDDDQLELRLHEEDWAAIIKSAADSMALRANVRGITLEYSIAPNLPTVGADRVSIHEVINNLVDNAIKYSGNSKRIRINTHLNNEGLVETTVQDWGVGIPASIMPNLFTKFYRDHHNRAQIGGTGLGLYLSKAIVTAHGGNIWVRSKEGEGSIFGFTLVPYARLAAELKNSDNKEMIRGAHGWIKNHSLYRR